MIQSIDSNTDLDGDETYFFLDSHMHTDLNCFGVDH